MERIVNLHIETLPEGFYLATSENVQRLVAQCRTIAETIFSPDPPSFIDFI
jgi:hypothetical protein